MGLCENTLILTNIMVIFKYNEIIGRMNGYAGANARRRSLDGPGPTVVHQKPGPLQTIFDLPPYEVS